MNLFNFIFNNRRLNFSILFFFLLPFFSFSDYVHASDNNGTIDTTFKYAWGENIGWLNFGCDGCNVSVTDSGLSGYAWSKQYGWINLSPNISGNTGVLNTNTGVLSGYAWGSNVGWINFSGVTISSTGEFTGYATVKSDNSRINFNCNAEVNSCATAEFKVATDWRPAANRAGNSKVFGSTSSGGAGAILNPINNI